MLIGRIHKSIAQHNWAAVSIDIIVVIVGILLAFQIDRWAEEQRNNKLEQEYLLRLKQDLEFEIESMDRASSFAENRISAVRYLSQALEDASVVQNSPTNLPWAIETATWRSFPQINAFVFGELQSSGNLALIHSESLRRNLNNHYTTLQHSSRVGMDLQAQHQFEMYTAGLLTIEELVSIENGALKNQTFLISVTRAEEIIDAFKKKDDAIALLPSLVQHHTFNKKSIVESKERAKEIIEQIDALLEP